MKYRVKATKRFQKDVKRCQKRNPPINAFKKVIRLLVWEQNDEELILMMTNTGSHSDIF